MLTCQAGFGYPGVRQAIDEAIIEARHNPETASSLFALASYGRSDPESLDRLRATFAKEGFHWSFCHITCQTHHLHSLGMTADYLSKPIPLLTPSAALLSLVTAGRVLTW